METIRHKTIGRNKCAFINCGKRRDIFPQLRMFKFPKDSHRAKQWILNSGNLTLLDMPPEKLCYQVVCSEHFQADDYAVTSERHKLKVSAIPQSAVQDDSPNRLKVLAPTKTYRAKLGAIDVSRLPSTSKQIDSPSSTPPRTSKFLTTTNPNECSNCPHHCLKRQLISDTPDTNIQKLKRRIQRQSKQLRQQATTIFHLKREIQTVKQEYPQDISKNREELNFPSEHSKTSVMQITHDRNHTPWNSNEKKMAILSFYKFPSAYIYLRDKLGITLPGINTIKKTGQC